MHNFCISSEECRSLFREEFLSTKLSLQDFDVNNIFRAKTAMRTMTWKERIHGNEVIDAWNNQKRYPETLNENKKILDDYLSLCEKTGAFPVMFLAPATADFIKHFNKQLIDELCHLVYKAQQKHKDSIYINGWDLKFLSDEDFFDPTHMNIQGAAKFSAFLNLIIEKLDKKFL